MFIQSSNIGMSSERSFTSQMISSVNVSAISAKTVLNVDPNSVKVLGEKGENKNSLQNSMKQLMERFEEIRTNRATTIKEELESFRKIQMSAMEYLLRWFFGDAVSRKADKEISNTASTGSDTTMQWTTMECTQSQFFAEDETTSFSTTGTVITGEGRKIEFQLSVEMSRSFQTYYESSYRYSSLNLCDPLVINLDTEIASVSDQKFMFDLDSDGVLDEISMLNSGSGFLALDKNQDGQINDGSELFGTVSGDGFKDLSEYDLDKNGWIDEADEVFEKLVIWTKDASQNNCLCSLAKAGIGAIFLGNVSTKFSLNSSANNSTNGVIQKTGIFLYEEGITGTIQHLDLVK